MKKAIIIRFHQFNLENLQTQKGHWKNKNINIIIRNQTDDLYAVRQRH